MKLSNLNHRTKCTGHRTGAMLVLIAITLPIMIIMAAFALNVAWMQLVRTELRTATDASSRAAAKTLSLQQDVPTARQEAKKAARRNRVANSPLLVRNREIEFGFSRQPSSGSRFVFSPGGEVLNSVRVTGNRTATSRGGPVDLFLGGVLGVNTFEPIVAATSTQLDRDICLVVDRSGSMMRNVVGGGTPGPNCGPPHPTLSRWGGLSIAVAGFVDELEQTPQQEQCALVSYSSDGRECGISFTTSDINADLEFTYQPIRDEMARLSSRPVKGFTNIAAGIDDGIDVLTGPRSRPFALRSIVLLTDGIKNRGREPVQAANDAAAENIVINAVTFSDEADFARMRAVANATGGKHYHAPNAAALEAIFREIASTLPVLITD
ncbi:VWA domain-containing protein [Bythopirellula goksoeyrii]|uniref:von Willebrand factor type A domain protein n=1 Tax=Bythopirellula goksoeyrii TaxID=1400387 RepID=A0A5B9QKH0_9BACT|nr:VWA domain-containing protein [Bythopirellula goksoeyrii]QEG38035.1 von Willebrand factor type A domain protein [Bythopirellula goksoeyrii]